MSALSENGIADRRGAFARLRKVCVDLLPRLPLSTATALPTSQRLRDLQSTLRSLPTELLDGSLLDYAFFPLSQLLRINSLESFELHETVLQEIMQSMALVVPPWRRAPKAMPSELMLHIWLVCVLVLGGPMDEKGKGRQVAWSDETVAATLQVLWTLLEPLQTGETAPPTPPLSLLAHSTTALLDTAENAPELASRLLALQALQCLADQSLLEQSGTALPLMANFFPGCVSTLARLLAPRQPLRVRTRETPTALLERCLGILRLVVVAVLGNVPCQRILSKKAAEVGLIDLESIATGPPRPVPETEPPEGGLGSIAWLRATSAQLHLAIVSFGAAMRDHLSPLVRTAYTRFAGALLVDCSRTCDDRTHQMALADLVMLTCDELPEVSIPARVELERTDDISVALSILLLDSLKALPQVIISHGDDESKVARATSLLRGSAMALATVGTTMLYRDVGRTADRWSMSLLFALEFATSGIVSETVPRDRSARAWIATSKIPAAETSSPPQPSVWPNLKFKRISSSKSAHLLRQAVVELGRTTHGSSQTQAAVLIEHYLSLATGALSPKLRAAAWWLLDAALESAILPVNRSTARQRRAARNAVQAVLGLAEEELAFSPEGVNDAAVDDLVITERRRGASAVLSRLDRFAGNGPSEASRVGATIEMQATQVVTLCLSLRCLTTAAAVLGTAFRAHLSSTLYLLLSHLDPIGNSMQQMHAEVALVRIAESSGYSSIEDMLLDNVDYVINSVSQRLRLPRLDPTAPGVLVTMIRLVGSDIVPLIQDVVDDVLDALDDFHEYDLFCAGLLAVLDSLIKSMSVEGDVAVHREPKDRRRSGSPDPRRELDSFDAWVQEKSNRDSQPPEPLVSPPHGTWVSEALDESDTAIAPEEAETAPSRSQAVCAATLDKALHFISYDSPFLRARVLSLVASGVPVLADRPSELMPVIHRAWPYVLHRLSASESPSVVVEAALLVEQLARHAGEFMSRRIVDDAWPRFRKLLVQMERSDDGADLHGRFTRVQQIQLAILGAMTDICHGVDMQDELAWDLARGMRLFLQHNADIRGRAALFYAALRKRQPEIVWLALSGLVGD